MTDYTDNMWDNLVSYYNIIQNVQFSLLKQVMSSIFVKEQKIYTVSFHFWTGNYDTSLYLMIRTVNKIACLYNGDNKNTVILNYTV